MHVYVIYRLFPVQIADVSVVTIVLRSRYGDILLYNTYVFYTFKVHIKRAHVLITTHL